jgi:hypothetical protein
MMERGWIFPDGTEYDCGIDIHDAVVSKFIEGLEIFDKEIYDKIQMEIEGLSHKYGLRNLYSDYAIEKLGWIKVGTSVFHNLQYAGYDWQEELIEPYEKEEFSIIGRWHESESYFPIDCDVVKVIQHRYRKIED